MEYPDLTPCDYAAERFSTLPTAVGWLDGPGFTRGSVDDALIRKLIEIYEDSPFRDDLHYRGRHPCPYCGAVGVIDTPFGTLDVGSRNLLVPGSGELFFSPSMLLHYILGHDYRPPQRFLDAVDRVDLDDPSFVDDVTATYLLPEPFGSQGDPYARYVGDLLLKRQRAPRMRDHWRAFVEVLTEAIPECRWSFPPCAEAPLERELVERLLAQFKALREPGIRAISELIDAWAGSRWADHLRQYLELYQSKRPPWWLVPGWIDEEPPPSIQRLRSKAQNKPEQG